MYIIRKSVNLVFIVGGFLQYSAKDSVDNFFDTFTHQAFEDDQANSIKMGTLMGKFVLYQDKYANKQSYFGIST